MTAREVGMVQENRKARSESAAERPIPEDVMAFGGQRIEALMNVQKELLDTFEQINRERLARAQQETKLASEFAGRLTTARSIPDVMTAYQEWAGKRMEMFTEDGRKLAEDSQKIFSATARLLSNGTKGSGI
jgi:hypothetical protein